MTLNETIELIRSTINSTHLENKVYIVGGWCRDTYWGIEPKDIDILVNGSEEDLKNLLTMLKPHATQHAEYPRFGTAMLTVGENQLEFVLPRKESYTDDSRKPDVESGSDKVSLLEDAMRRDFTINTLLYNISTREYEDPTGEAIKHLKKRLLRTPTLADVTLKDDPLRILRAIRMLQEYCLKPHQSLRRGIVRNASLVCPPKVSMERIKGEFIKILSLSDARSKQNNIISMLLVLKTTIPELTYVINPVILGTERGVDYRVKLALLFSYLPVKTVKDILRRLKFSNADVNSISRILELQNNLPEDYELHWSEYEYRQFILDCGTDFNNVLNFRHRRNSLLGLSIDNITKLGLKCSEYECKARSVDLVSPLNGNEIHELFGVTGLGIKKIKDLLTKLVLSGTLDPNDRKKAAQIINGTNQKETDCS
jgi:tRNA nucleotidyltransferase/poly(A) polymerase